jgi:hypothetical protein
MGMDVLAWLLAALAGAPALLTLLNLPLLRPPPPAASAAARRLLSVLIPARDEEANIARALQSVLANRGVDYEVLVLDDDSSDATAEIAAALAARDGRVRLMRGGPVAAGVWGKPLACARLAEAARGEVLVFMDADVRLGPDALARLAAALESSRAGMVSGVPRQITVTPAETLIVPLIHFVMLGFLPLGAMRTSKHPGFGVACGQLLAVERAAYAAAGGHRGIADKVHDGLALARALRRAGFATDLVDLTDVASCRMYASWRAVVNGFAKNAHEGLGSPRGLLPWTLLLIGGQTLWLPLLPFAALGFLPWAPLVLAAALSWTTRAVLAARFKQPALGVWLHPVAVAALVSIQWYALGRRLLRRPVAWKERTVLSA